MIKINDTFNRIKAARQKMQAGHDDSTNYRNGVTSYGEETPRVTNLNDQLKKWRVWDRPGQDRDALVVAAIGQKKDQRN